MSACEGWYNKAVLAECQIHVLCTVNRWAGNSNFSVCKPKAVFSSSVVEICKFSALVSSSKLLLHFFLGSFRSFGRFFCRPPPPHSNFFRACPEYKCAFYSSCQLYHTTVEGSWPRRILNKCWALKTPSLRRQSIKKIQIAKPEVHCNVGLTVLPCGKRGCNSDIDVDAEWCNSQGHTKTQVQWSIHQGVSGIIRGTALGLARNLLSIPNVISGRWEGNQKFLCPKGTSVQEILSTVEEKETFPLSLQRKRKPWDCGRRERRKTFSKLWDQFNRKLGNGGGGVRERNT